MKLIVALLLIFASFTISAQTNAIAGSKDLLQVGDSIVLTLDTSIVVAYMPQPNSLTERDFSENVTFTFEGITYKMLQVSTSGNITTPTVLINAREVNGSRCFNALMSASLKRKGRTILNSCKLTYATVGNCTKACMFVTSSDNCNPSTTGAGSKSCTMSASDDEKSLAYEFEQFSLAYLSFSGGR